MDRRWFVPVGVLAAATVAVAFARANEDRGPATAPASSSAARAPEAPVTELPPLRQYPPIDVADLAPERPPFVELKGFPPPPPAIRISTGPVRRFSILRLEMDHAIEVLKMSPAGELPTPADASYRVGWYVDFGQPGEGGNAVFTAHETWNHFQAPFFNLHRAETGDEVIIDMADGRRLTYAVLSNVRYDVRTIPMNDIVRPANQGAEAITLITCGGRIVYDEKTGYGEYLDRDVVVARRVS